ncbi:hypothetical protein [Azospirillum endophyticum]
MGSSQTIFLPASTAVLTEGAEARPRPIGPGRSAPTDRTGAGASSVLRRRSASAVNAAGRRQSEEPGCKPVFLQWEWRNCKPGPPRSQ